MSVMVTPAASDGPWFVAVNVNVVSWPATGSVDAAAFTNSISADGVIGPGGGTGVGLVLLPGFGSGVSLDADAVLPRSEPSPVYDGLSLTVKVNVADAPEASVASGPQETVCPTAVQPSTDYTNVNPAGSGSLTRTLTADASEGPLFVTVTS